jgi:stalled ribosome rescue protein Dom34
VIFDHVNDLYFLRGVAAPGDSIELSVSRTERKATIDQRRISKVSLPVVNSTAIQSGGQ